MNIRKFRQRHPQIEAIQWTGDNAEDLRKFTSKSFYFIDPEDREDDPDQTAAVFTTQNHRWEGVYPGDWIIRTADEEIRMMRKDDFERDFEEI